MLHFARRIALGMDIADFLQLQRTFNRQRIIRAATQIEHVARGGDQVGHRGNVFIMRERGVECGGGLDQMADDFAFFFVGQFALHQRQMCGECGEHRQLAGKGLG